MFDSHPACFVMDDLRSPRFLIVRLSHIGDCILTLPLAAAIKKQWPGAQVVWAAEPAAIQLLELHPAIDVVERVPKGWVRNPAAWLDLRARLRRHNVDWVLDPQSLLKSSALGWISGCPRRIGFAGQHAREFSHRFNNHRVEATRPHLLDRTMELLSPVLQATGAGEAEIPVPEFRLPVCPVADRIVSDWLACEKIGEHAIINPGASWPSKRWCPRRFGEVARWMAGETGICPVVTWSGEAEYELAEEISLAAQGAARIAPATTLRQYAALAARATLFVGCDTGPMHIAAAAGTRCLVLYGPTLPQHSGAWGRGHVALQKWHQTGRNRKRDASNAAMMEIRAAEVCSALEEMLAARDTSVRRSA